MDEQGYGRAVRAARAWAGLTMAELAQQIGVSWQTVSSWERGKTEPRARYLAQVAIACGLKLATVLRWAEGEP